MKTTVFMAVMLVGIAYAVGVTIYHHETCNENTCVSRVSQCQLTGACGCTLENCTCCVNCTLCLAELWDSCCACVNMCKPRNTSNVNAASYSTIGTLERAVDWTDTLFRALTFGKPMPDAQWTVDRVTLEQEGIDVNRITGVRPNPPTSGSSGLTSTKVSTTAASVNASISAETSCTVAYLKACFGLEKCQNTCHNMGASKYRWFHTGCCECIGQSCLSYGKNKALCSDCPND